MINFFDYIFYRVYKQYEKWREGYSYPFAEGIIVVIQGFFILSLITVLSSLNILPRKFETNKTYALIVLFILYLINHLRYKKKYIEIIKKYDAKEDLNKKRNGIILLMFIITIILLPIVIGSLRNNLGYNI